MFRLKFRFDFMRLCLLLASVVWLFLGVPQPIAAQGPVPNIPVLGCPGQTPGPNPWNPCNWDAHKIMAEIENPHADLVTVAAHRGTHSLAGTTQAPGVPENSLDAIGIAAQEGWESIEIDVKRTSDGVPVLSHDKVWGRETCTWDPNQDYFAPFATSPSAPGAKPPAKPAPVRHKYSLDLNMYVENVLNHPNYTNPSGVLSSTLFGRTTADQGARALTFGVFFNF